jgi:hypothetical protein
VNKGPSHLRANFFTQVTKLTLASVETFFDLPQRGEVGT